MPESHPNIHAAIVAVRKAVPYVQEEKVDGLKYTFVGIEGVLSKLRPALDAHGIVIAPIRSVLSETGEYQTKGSSSSGTVMHRVRVRVRYIVAHAESGTSIETEGLGEAADSGDKAVPKAMTAALKAMLRQTFLLESGALDPDTYASEQLGATEARMDLARRALRTPKDMAELQTQWERIKSWVFSDAQLKTLEAAYEANRERIADSPRQPASNPNRPPAGGTNGPNGARRTGPPAR